MNFSFEVGTAERHLVSFDFNQTWGNLSITVDGQVLVNDLRMLSLALTKTYTFEIGTRERHTVRIEKKRKLFLAGLRPQKYRVFVDNHLLHEYEGF
jgi:hypothetical protein